MNSDKQTVKDLTFIERLDPRVKFFCLLLLAIQVFTLRSETSLASASVVLVIAVVASRIPFLTLMRRLLSISVFIVLIVCINAFTVSGDVVFDVLGMYATREGLLVGAILSARIILLMIAATVFVRTTPIPSMVDAIEATIHPVHKHLGAITQVLTIALNFVPMLIQSAQQIKKAQIARGADPDRNIVRQLRFAFSAVLPLFAMTLRSSEHLALAMESRGYDPLAERTYYTRLRMRPEDWLAAFLIIAQCAIAAAVGR